MFVPNKGFKVPCITLIIQYIQLNDMVCDYLSILQPLSNYVMFNNSYSNAIFILDKKYIRFAPSQKIAIYHNSYKMTSNAHV